MHAVRHHQFGPPEVLVVEELPDPAPASDQARIRVAAAGVHVLDTMIRAGIEGGPAPLPDLPVVPGREVAGTVDRVGADVDPGWEGRRVVAHLGMAGGGYAELALAAGASLHEVPSSLDHDQAVAMIGTGRTAFGILEAAEIGPDDVVLVTAAAGGLGTLLVQLAHRAGAVVVGTAGGPRKLDLVRSLGADVVVDHDRPGWADDVRDRLGGRPVSLALVAVGGARGASALALLGDKGRAVVYGWSGGEPAALTGSQRDRGVEVVTDIGRRVMGRPGGMRDLEELALGAAGWGEVEAVVGQAFLLEHAADAHRAVEERATMGKTVLHP